MRFRRKPNLCRGKSPLASFASMQPRVSSHGPRLGGSAADRVGGRGRWLDVETLLVVPGTRTENHVRQNLRSAQAIGGLVNPNAVALLHGTLAGYSRRGASVSMDLLLGWAADEGW